MATAVMLPDVGEGIDDVTIVRWLVNEGAAVSEGDVLLEVATDKVDTEVTAPVSGVLLKQNFGEGALVGVDQALAYIGAAGEAVGDASPPTAEVPSAAPVAQSAPEIPSVTAGPEPKATPVAQRVAQERGIDLGEINGSGSGGKITKEDVLAFAQEDGQVGPGGTQKELSGLPGELADVLSLSVQRLVAQFGVDVQTIAEGRPLSALTRYDILSAVESARAGKAVTVTPGFSRPVEPVSAAATPAPSQTKAQSEASPAAAPSASAPQLQEREELIQVNRMRQLTAKSVSQSAFTAPHVTTMWDLDMSSVLEHRAANRKEFDAAGVKLTVTPYLILAILEGLKAVPAANGSWTDEGVVIKRHYNIGMAVALPQDQYGMGGLIVPVIHNAEDLNLLGLSRAVNDLAQRARANQLKPADIQGGTFTLSNYGVSGSRFQTPIIVQPQVGILGVGAIEKRPVVVSQGHPLDANRGDYLAFKPMTTLGFSYDHRVLDGATADYFCAAVKASLEGWTTDM